MKRGAPKRDWSDIEITADDPCRICGICGRTERAHVSGRKHDRPKPGQTTLWVNPLDIVGLCGPATDHHSCHYGVDNGLIDLLDHLTTEEQVRAVEVMGTIEAARRRLAPSDFHRAIQAARVEVREAAL